MMVSKTKYHYAHVPRHFPMLLMALILLLAVSCSYAFVSPQPQPPADRAGALQHEFKRFTIAATLALGSFLGWETHHPALRPPVAQALQEKNEMLCNTGFFTNVGAWYCTDIGKGLCCYIQP
jgi:hypothetical protein